MIEVVRYTNDKKEEWDDFIKKSDIPVFMFYRDYMEYHKDRFDDSSLLIYSNDKLKSVFPAHIKNKMLISHGGLTFGGLISDKRVSYEETIQHINNINKFGLEQGLNTLSIKLAPSIYSETFSQSQSYIYQRNIATHSELKLSTCIKTKHHKFPKSSIEKRKLKLSQFNLGFSDDFASFWSILDNNLKKFHNTAPVHTLNEIKHLQAYFPEGIKLFVVTNKETGNIDAGAVLYKFKNVLKLQYLAASEVGRNNRASHALYYGFISEYLDKVDYIDLGNCMEDRDEINTNLLYIKERFGAKVYSMEEYELPTNLVLN